MQIRHFEPLHVLKGYIEKIWVFESKSGVPNEDIKLIVPNGRIKLIIPCHNVSSKTNGSVSFSEQNTIFLTGITDAPRIINDEENNPSGTIGFEFNADQAYRFFHMNLSEIKNQIVSLSHFLVNSEKQLNEQVSNTDSIKQKIILMQQFLTRRLFKQKGDSLFDFCAKRIRLSKGKISIKQLEKETGYSARWLNMKFLDKVGVSPKNLSQIIRFRELYNLFSHHPSEFFVEKEIYQYYYDQSHFIRDFKRFTGLSPSKLAESINNFGEIFS